MQSSSWFDVQAKGLDSIQRDVLGLLALYGDANISTLTELAIAWPASNAHAPVEHHDPAPAY
jgi:hypothetical protein